MPLTSRSSILITGGFGMAFIAEALRRFPEIQRLVTYRCDEIKQWELQQHYPVQGFHELR